MKHLLTHLCLFIILPLMIITHPATAEENTEEPLLTFSYDGEPLESTIASPESATLIVSEAVGKIILTATLSQVRPHDVTFSFQYNFGSATRFNDFDFRGVTTETNSRGQLVPGANITIPEGELSISFPIVSIREEAIYEGINALNRNHDELEEVYETLIFSLKSENGLALSHRTLTVNIEDNDDLPTISLSNSDLFPLSRNDDGSYDATINESNGGIPLKLSVKNTTSSYPMEIGYTIANGEGVNIDPDQPDYNDPGESVEPRKTGRFVIPALAFELDFSIYIQDDVSREPSETFTFTLYQADSLNASIHSERNNITITIEDNDASTGVINDTGVTTCYNDEADIIDCLTYPTEAFPVQNQDGSNYESNQFTSLSYRGERINNSNEKPLCIYDEKTNLVWQNGTDLYLFSWYSTMENINGGNEGYQGSTGTNTSLCGPLKQCNTKIYASVLNKLPHDEDASVEGLCNMQNWRVPKLGELLSIMDFEPDNDSVLINNNFNAFNGTYWTATPVVISPDHAWCVYFGIKEIEEKHVRQCKKNSEIFVRMVATCTPNEDEPNQPC